MVPPDTIWHKESLRLKEIFGTREGFEICPYQLFQALIKVPSGTADTHVRAHMVQVHLDLGPHCKQRKPLGT